MRGEYQSVCIFCGEETNSILKIAVNEVKITDGRCHGCNMFGDYLKKCEYCEEDLENVYLPIIDNYNENLLEARNLFNNDDNNQLALTLTENSNNINNNNSDYNSETEYDNDDSSDSRYKTCELTTDDMLPLLIIRFIRDLITDETSELTVFFRLIMYMIRKNKIQNSIKDYMEHKEGTLEIKRIDMYVKARLAIMRSLEINSVSCLMMHSWKIFNESFRVINRQKPITISFKEYNIILIIGVKWLKEENKKNDWNIYTNKCETDCEVSILTI
jgi:hypothetical protein